MLQSMGSQRVGRDLVTEKQPPPNEKTEIIKAQGFYRMLFGRGRIRT